MFSEPLRIIDICISTLLPRAINPPVFIIGHWRSGTSFLQDALAKDRRFHYLSLYRMIAAQHFTVTDAWLRPGLNKVVMWLNWGYPLQRTTLNLDYSGELDVALTFLGSPSAYTWAHFFPKKFDYFFDELVFNQTNKKWVEDYILIMRKLQRQRPGAQLLIKSPGDTARINVLIQAFPDAKFIFLTRDENETIRSNEYLWEVIQKNYSYQLIDEERIQTIISKTYVRLLDHFHQHKNCIPESQLYTLNLTELKDNPGDALERIYSHFNFGTVPSSVTQFLQKNAFNKGGAPNSTELNAS